jgi:uncharacterized membrane protein (TIGR02234 family)
MLALLVAMASAGMSYLAVSLWVIRDVAVRAADLAEVRVADLVDSQRHYGGAILTLVAAAGALAAAVLLMRSLAKPRPDTARYERRPAKEKLDNGGATTERAIWDALDEGHDPTEDPALPDNKGR